MTTDERIENLEKGLASARRLNRWLLAAVGLALGVWILAGTFGPTMAAAPGGGGAVKEVRANRFVVEDENGKVRVTLGMVKPTTTMGLVNKGPSLELFDESGKVRARLNVVTSNPPAGTSNKGDPALSLFKGGPSLFLYDDNGNPRTIVVEGGLSIYADRDYPRWCTTLTGTGLFVFGNFITRASLDLSQNGPTLSLSDENGKPRAGLGVTPIGPGMVLYDEAGESRAVLQMSKISGGPSLVLSDAAGKGRAVLHVVSTGPGVGPGLVLYDAAGKNRAALAVYGDWPGVRLFGADGATIWKAP